MKRIHQTLTLLALTFVLLVSTTVPALAAPASLTLTEISYSPAGINFTFTFEGTLTRDQWRGTVKTDSGETYPLFCWKKDSHTLRCTTPDKVAGQFITVSLAGYIFYTKAPNASTPEPAAATYSCPEDGTATLTFVFQLSNGSSTTLSGIGFVSAGEVIDTDKWASSMVTIVEFLNQPNTVTGWTLESFECNAGNEIPL